MAPLALNFLRWVHAFLILLPFAWQLLRADSPLWGRFGRFDRFAVLGVRSARFGLGFLSSPPAFRGWPVLVGWR